MIFTGDQAHEILKGRQTQTRRLATATRCPYRVSFDYPVQVRRSIEGAMRSVSVGRIKILTRDQHRAGEITFLDARAEGYRTTDDWKVAWVRRLEGRWIKRELIDRVEVYDDDVSIVKWILLERFEQHHARRLVWALGFEPVGDVPRFMARAPVAFKSGDYTGTAALAIDKEECVDEATQERYARAKQEEGVRMRASFKADLERERAERRSRKRGERIATLWGDR